MQTFHLLFSLLAGHALCDYPLQGDFLARGKNRHASIPGVPWYQCLLAHSLIHAGCVVLITGRLEVGVFELGAHFLIDFGKCEGWFGFNADQMLHAACKVAWLILLKSSL